uniref:Uncharacterized protein n=1 Tax=Oryza brachyantha TaxID=4533 RepID=J3MTM0_ORYBR
MTLSSSSLCSSRSSSSSSSSSPSSRTSNSIITIMDHRSPAGSLHGHGGGGGGDDGGDGDGGGGPGEDVLAGRQDGERVVPRLALHEPGPPGAEVARPVGLGAVAREVYLVVVAVGPAGVNDCLVLRHQLGDRRATTRVGPAESEQRYQVEDLALRQRHRRGRVPPVTRKNVRTC